MQPATPQVMSCDYCGHPRLRRKILHWSLSVIICQYDDAIIKWVDMLCSSWIIINILKLVMIAFNSMFVLWHWYLTSLLKFWNYKEDLIIKMSPLYTKYILNSYWVKYSEQPSIINCLVAKIRNIATDLSLFFYFQEINLDIFCYLIA